MSRSPFWGGSQLVCARDGHVVGDEAATFCPEHGSPVFTHCQTCEGPWTFVQIGYARVSQRGANFCAHCAAPAPWASRTQRIAWIQDRVATSTDLDSATALELREMLEKVAAMEADDRRQLAAWESVKRRAPAVWSFSRRVLETVLTDYVKKQLGF